MNFTIISNYLEKTKENSTVLSAFLLALILILIPLPIVFSNIATIVFILWLFLNKSQLNFRFYFSLILPILLYLLMSVSLFWSPNVDLSLKGLSRELLLLIFPLIFLIKPFFNSKVKDLTFKFYAFGMVFFALWCFFKATLRYFETGNENTFLFHDLVTLDVNAIYVAIFASFCFFYFIQIKNKNTFDLIGIYILFFFILLLSSKTVFFIDLCILICYYFTFAKASTGTKIVSAAIVLTFLFVSFTYVQNFKIRILEEYQTAFVDNTTSSVYGTSANKVYNISLKQAWQKDKYTQNDFIPGTALRVFHLKIFFEILHEKNIFFKGLGLDAAENTIEKKYKEHTVFSALNYFNFHNQFVQIFAELGIFGFLIFTLMVFINFRNAFLNKDFLHFVFAVSTFIIFLTESILCRQRGVVFFIVLYCIFNTSNKKLNNFTTS